MTYEEQLRQAARERRARFYGRPPAPRPDPLEDVDFMVGERLPVPPAPTVAEMPDCHRPELRMILRAVSEASGVPITDIASHRRTRPIVLPRQVGMALAAILTPLSLPRIGQRVGGRDHTTVLHARRKVDAGLAEGDRAMRRLVVRTLRQMPVSRQTQLRWARQIRDHVAAQHPDAFRRDLEGGCVRETTRRATHGADGPFCSSVGVYVDPGRGGVCASRWARARAR